MYPASENSIDVSSSIQYMCHVFFHFLAYKFWSKILKGYSHCAIERYIQGCAASLCRSSMIAKYAAGRSLSNHSFKPYNEFTHEKRFRNFNAIQPKKCLWNIEKNTVSAKTCAEGIFGLPLLTLTKIISKFLNITWSLISDVEESNEANVIETRKICWEVLKNHFQLCFEWHFSEHT